MKEGIRDKIWRILTERLEQGSLLPGWAVVLRFVLYPLQTFYYVMSDNNGYDVRSNTWKIHGIRYSDELFRSFYTSDGELYRFKNINGVVTVEKIYEDTDTYS